MPGMPMVGTMLTELTSRRRFDLARVGAIAPTPAAKPGVDQLVLSNPTTHNRVTLHLSADETMTALLNDIRNAKRSYYIETFIWHDDEAGQEVARALGERVQLAQLKGETFDAKVLIDSMGMRDQPKGEHFQEIRDMLERSGVDVLVFNRDILSLKAPGIPLTHRKLYIADGEKFISGGRNIANEYLKSTYQSGGATQVAWHDLAYTVEGDEATRITANFFHDWALAGGKVPENLPKAVPAVGGTAKVQTFVTDPLAHVYEIRQVHAQAIRSAQREIIATYPYFSDKTYINELIEAKRSNTAKRAALLKQARTPQERAAIDQAVPELKIKVIMPALKESGMASLFLLLHQETAADLLKEGIEVRLYKGDRVNGELIPRTDHLKAMLIDGKLLSIGSANADARSYHDNFELDTLIADPQAVADFKRRVATPDWNGSAPVTLAQLDHRPFWQKAIAKLLKWFDFLF